MRTSFSLGYGRVACALFCVTSGAACHRSSNAAPPAAIDASAAERLPEEAEQPRVTDLSSSPLASGPLAGAKITLTSTRARREIHVETAIDPAPDLATFRAFGQDLLTRAEPVAGGPVVLHVLAKDSGRSLTCQVGRSSHKPGCSVGIAGVETHDPGNYPIVIEPTETHGPGHGECAGIVRNTGDKPLGFAVACRARNPGGCGEPIDGVRRWRPDGGVLAPGAEASYRVAFGPAPSSASAALMRALAASLVDASASADDAGSGPDDPRVETIGESVLVDGVYPSFNGEYVFDARDDRRNQRWLETLDRIRTTLGFRLHTVRSPLHLTHSDHCQRTPAEDHAKWDVPADFVSAGDAARRALARKLHAELVSFDGTPSDLWLFNGAQPSWQVTASGALSATSAQYAE